MNGTHNNILDSIGNTPLVRINHLCPREDVEIYAKIEGANPTGSIKDRIAYEMIVQAEKEGSLVHGKTIIEPTSGNTGIGLAMVGAVKGYDVLIVMSDAVSIERRQAIAALGGRIELTPGERGTDGAIIRAHELVNQDPERYFMPDQFSNHFIQLAHYKTTAEEIWRQMDGRIEYFVAGIGTSGTLMGVSTYLHEKDKRIQVVCAHPVRGHYIQGLKNLKDALVPTIFDPRKIDITINVESEAALDMARQIVKREGILAGMSSGAAIYACYEVARYHAKPGVRIVTIFPDRAERYFSTRLFNGLH